MSSSLEIMALLICFLLPSIVLSVSSTGDLTCSTFDWTPVFGEWEFPEHCHYENTDEKNGAMAWIGEDRPDSLEWRDYTVEMLMTPAPEHTGGNGGLAFYIQDVGACGTCGKYYAVSLLLSNPDSIAVHIGKWQDHYDTVMSFDMPYGHADGDTYHIKAEIKTKNDLPHIKVWIDNIYLGNWTDSREDEPKWLYGSVGARNYNLPSVYKQICVNGCNQNSSGIGSNGAGGWIFFAIIFGGLFLYFVIGYIINGIKSKEFKNIKKNIPHIEFWKLLPKLTFIGCQVSYETVKNFMFTGKRDKVDLDTADAPMVDQDNDHDDDQTL